MKRNRLTLQTQMLAWAISMAFISAGAFVGATVLYHYYRIPQIVREVEYSLQKHAQTQRLELEDWFDEKESDIARLASLRIFQSLNYEEISDSLQRMRQFKSQYENLMFGDAEGVERTVAAKGVAIKDRDYFQAGTQGRNFMSDILIGRVSGMPVIVFSSPIQGEGGTFRGIVFGTVKANTIDRILNQGELNTPYKTARSILVSSKRLQLKFRTGTADSTVPGDKIALTDLVSDFDPDLLNEVLAGKSGVSVWVERSGKRVVSAFEYLPKQGWAVIRSVDEAEILEPVYEQIKLMMLLALLIFLLVLPLAVLAANQIRRPVKWLIKQSGLIRDGNLTEAETILDTVNVVEFQELCIIYKEMALTIRQQMGDLEEKNRDLADFSYVVSHDLKAPLRGISALAHWLEQDNAEKLDDEGRKHIALMQGRIHRMEELLDGILRYSRIGRTAELDAWVDLNALLRDIVDGLHVPEHIVVTVVNELPTVWADPTRIRQVFENLIDNAVKFMDKAEGRVDIGCKSAGSVWRFFVRDNGPGIAPEYHEKVFRMFQTLQPRDQYESTGVGLAIVKRIVERYGGRIRVSQNRDQGAAFRFTWPRKESEQEEGLAEVGE